MMLAVTVLLAAAPQLAAPGLTANGAPREKADAFNEYFAQQVNLHGVRVITGSEIAAVLGLERQKQLLGCNDEGSSCVAELAGALGVTGLITGSVSLIGSEWVVNLKVVAADGSRVIAVYSTRAADERAVLDFLGESATELVARLGPARRGPGRAWIPVAAGAAALLVGGGVCTLIARLAEAQLRSGQGLDSFQAAHGVRQRGELAQGLSLALYSVGGLAAAVAVVMFVTTGREVQASAVVVPGGAFGAVTFTLP